MQKKKRREAEASWSRKNGGDLDEPLIALYKKRTERVRRRRYEEGKDRERKERIDGEGEKE